MNKTRHVITGLLLSLHGHIHERLGQYNGLMPTRPEARLRRDNRIQTIHFSLVIEGNTLELDQVATVPNNKRVLAPAREILEVKNAVQEYHQPHSTARFPRTIFMQPQGYG